MKEKEGPLSRTGAQARIREIRQNLRGGSHPRQVIDLEASALGDSSDDESSSDVGSPLAAKYEMEMAAHRDTTSALLAEKDRTIAKLEELVGELRGRLSDLGERESSPGDRSAI